MRGGVSVFRNIHSRFITTTTDISWCPSHTGPLLSRGTVSSKETTSLTRSVSEYHTWFLLLLQILGVTHGHHHEDKSPSHHPGYVPVYGRHGYDISYGVSHGRDLLGSFSHFTGPYGPFGFWANLFHDRK